MSDARRSQTRARVAFVAIVVATGAAFGACTNYDRQNGEGCLKDSDCVSNYCLEQTCAAPPPILVGSYEDAGTSQDSGSSTADTGGSAPDSGGSSDSSASTDSSGDSSADGPPARDEAGNDSGGEDAADATLDAADDSNGETEDAKPDGADAVLFMSNAELPA
jgi:hypothetical protein